MKVNSQKFQEEEEAEAMKDKDNHPSVEEAIDWVQEYELVKQSKLSNLRRMKSKRLKAMIRRLSFLREKVKKRKSLYPMISFVLNPLIEFCDFPDDRYLPTKV